MPRRRPDGEAIAISGSEHLLLGLLEEGEGTAAQVLIGAGVEEEKLKSLIDQLIAPEGGVGLAIPGGLHPQSFRDPGKQCPGGRAFSYGAGGNRAHPAHDHQGSRECVATRLLHTMGVNLQKLYRVILDSMGIPEEVYREMNPGSQKCKPE